MIDWIDVKTNKEFFLSDYPEAFGFIYKINYSCGKVYYGKKNFFNKIILPKNKNRRKREIIWRESNNWRTYVGSSKLANGLVVESKFILDVAETKRALTYLETELLFKHNVIFNDNCLNKNIGSLYFDNIFDPLKVPLKKEYK